MNEKNNENRKLIVHMIAVCCFATVQLLQSYNYLQLLNELSEENLNKNLLSIYMAYAPGIITILYMISYTQKKWNKN